MSSPQEESPGIQRGRILTSPSWAYWVSYSILFASFLAHACFRLIAIQRQCGMKQSFILPRSTIWMDAD